MWCRTVQYRGSRGSVQILTIRQHHVSSKSNRQQHTWPSPRPGKSVTVLASDEDLELSDEDQSNNGEEKWRRIRRDTLQKCQDHNHLWDDFRNHLSLLISEHKFYGFDVLSPNVSSAAAEAGDYMLNTSTCFLSFTIDSFHGPNG